MHRRLPSLPARCSQEAGGNNYLWSADPPLRRRHSTSSSARTTVEMAAMHSPASSNKLKPPKFKSQITLAIEPMHMATSSTEEMICLMITSSRLPEIAPRKLGGSSSNLRWAGGNTRCAEGDDRTEAVAGRGQAASRQARLATPTTWPPCCALCSSGAVANCR